MSLAAQLFVVQLSGNPWTAEEQLSMTLKVANLRVLLVEVAESLLQHDLTGNQTFLPVIELVTSPHTHSVSKWIMLPVVKAGESSGASNKALNQLNYLVVNLTKVRKEELVVTWRELLVH